MSIRFSIVVNTYNRARSLKNTLDAFSYLRYPEFEIVVVNGPSTDDTQQLLQAYEGKIKIGNCPETNLSQSRNIGIGLASGDIVCFIDDDGIPEADWLDALARVYLADPTVGGAGGFVRDHTGVDYQCRYIVCNRSGDASFYDRAEQIAIEERPHAESYYSLIGVNSSFRREALLQIGGFDEEYAYFLDETDVCVRLTDAGWKIRFVPDAEVHHKYAASHLRNEKKIPTSLHYTSRSKVYFQFRNALPTASPTAVFQQAIRVREQIQWDMDNLYRLRAIEAERHASLVADVWRGFADGIRDAYAHPGGRPMPASALVQAPFHRFSPLLPTGSRLNLILISQDYPPAPCGGVGVFIHNLALALAREGHEVSVITRSPGRHTVDMEDGVWVHRLPLTQHGSRSYPELPDLPVNIRNHAYTVYDEAIRIQARRGATLTLSAIWDLEAAACIASKAFTNLVYLVTTYQLSLPSKPEWSNDAHYLQHHVEKMIAGERWLLDNAQQLIASTSGILHDVCQLNPGFTPRRPVPVIPFGLPAPPVHLPGRPAGSALPGLNVLFVGRFEQRKGVDLLLAAIPELFASHGDQYGELHFRLVGDSSIQVDGQTFKDRFLQQHRERPALLARVHFLGVVDDAALAAEYAHCDIFVAPSRYESFGLIYLEAMRWGKPCIGANVGGIPDVLPSTCGLLPEAGDPHALRQALATLISDPGLRQTLGSAGKEYFAAHYSTEAFTQRLRPLLKQAQQDSQAV